MKSEKINQILKAEIVEWKARKDIKVVYSLSRTKPVFLVVTELSGEYDDVLVFFFPSHRKSGELIGIAEITPEMLDQILKHQMSLPDGFGVKDLVMVYERTEVFTDFDEMIESLYLYPYAVEEYLNLKRDTLGFRCPVSGRIWECRKSDIAKATTSLAAKLILCPEQKRSLLYKVNSKPRKPQVLYVKTP